MASATANENPPRSLDSPGRPPLPSPGRAGGRGPAIAVVESLEVRIVLNGVFQLSARGTDVRTEVMAGLTTFLTMAYIIFVQPAVLSTDLAGRPTGMDLGAVLVATCAGSALASVLMGLLADYPIALAPGMGENFFFVTVVMALGGMGVPDAWQTALGMVFLSGRRLHPADHRSVCARR